ncbi:hypothetical protein F2P81_008169 [Scophthalmus maximus]|uniref:Uncharacterized protein n=1 Tax=Scophthalmus maximus TaxID=52904 RepID=A0A6A4T9T6_SCOMX|nr:hypothetical protein F2P81_008169 [Scophthalmus maximus]
MHFPAGDKTPPTPSLCSVLNQRTSTQHLSSSGPRGLVRPHRRETDGAHFTHVQRDRTVRRGNFDARRYARRRLFAQKRDCDAVLE